MNEASAEIGLPSKTKMFVLPASTASASQPPPIEAEMMMIARIPPRT
jgi:hypothetical protein